MKHKHHIIPRYEEGSDDPSNLVELTPIQHAMWHFAEWQRKGNWQDNLAWRVLCGRLTKEESIREAVILHNKSRKGIPREPRTPEVRRKIQTSLKKFYKSLDKPAPPVPMGGRGVRGRKPRPVELLSPCSNLSFVFESAVKAGECLNLNPSAITKCARGVWTHTKGWKVRYI
jgi:hypothetical protein